MISIGVVVEGPTDRLFWAKVLFRSFSGCKFNIINLSGKIPLIRQAPKLAEGLRSTGHQAAFFLVDADKSPCATAVLDLFDEPFRKEAFRQPVITRYNHIAVTFRELESWVLADEECIRDLFNCPEYRAPSPDEKPAGKAKFLQLSREYYNSLSGLKDADVASRAGSRFNPARAQKHSPSFDYFWRRLSAKIDVLRTAP